MILDFLIYYFILILIIKVKQEFLIKNYYLYNLSNFIIIIKNLIKYLYSHKFHWKQA